jgi:hypothetical protein
MNESETLKKHKKKSRKDCVKHCVSFSFLPKSAKRLENFTVGERIPMSSRTREANSSKK